ncbi:class I SAM-dependent methyltransferase [Robiginitalea sp. SC105]|uniref:class I SAM-dependent methyltransferase n=1 Tax=Robiginitalea sp. SC105 TaxID=2762332 RepID=UPI00163B2C80|nr:class I SAM-dependent methyltransferase [Robiginitalea sp. SC105]MBC2840074.1 class I SAM-dependent methyltransferase [Robiginitalea sp. SC105]
MGFYNKIILPKVIDWTCGQSPTMKQREKVIPQASGDVLEIGIGSGLNLPFYDATSVKSVIGIDPSPEIWKERDGDPDNLPFQFRYIETGAEDIPLGNNSMDTVVVTYSLCTIPDLAAAFSEIRRTLKPDGRLIFCEHGRAPDKAVARWQNRLNPLWKRLGGGCNLNRDIPAIITNNGFEITRMQTMYIPGWKPASFNFWGTAKIG